MSNVNSRPNKQAKGFTKHYERREKLGRVRVTNPKHPSYNVNEQDINRLIVRGTLDDLAKTKFLTKRVKKEHPVDKGFFKEVVILSEFGQNLLKRKRRDANEK